VANILSAARPKLQNWISDAESHDSESLDTFLHINDQINSVLNRYESFKKGDYVAAANPIPEEYNNSARGGSADLSLIDFDDSAGAAAPQAPSGGVNDLSGLFSAPTSQPSPHAQSFFGHTSPSFQQPPPQQPPSFFQPQFMFAPQAAAQSPVPTHFGAHNGSRPQTMSPPATIMLPTSPQPTPPTQSPGTFSNVPPQQSKDPFADLAGLF